MRWGGGSTGGGGGGGPRRVGVVGRGFRPPARTALHRPHQCLLLQRSTCPGALGRTHEVAVAVTLGRRHSRGRHILPAVQQCAAPPRPAPRLRTVLELRHGKAAGQLELRNVVIVLAPGRGATGEDEGVAGVAACRQDRGCHYCHVVIHLRLPMPGGSDGWGCAVHMAHGPAGQGKGGDGGYIPGQAGGWAMEGVVGQGGRGDVGDRRGEVVSKMGQMCTWAPGLTQRVPASCLGHWMGLRTMVNAICIA